jgi:hypothetical protein
MESYTVVISPSATQTRVLVSRGPDELLRAYLPPPSQVHHDSAMRRFLEGLALLLDRSLRVVLSVDAREAAFCLGLTDELGLACRAIFYEVEVVPRRLRRRRGRRIRGVGKFADLHPLRVATDHGGAP